MPAFRAEVSIQRMGADGGLAAAVETAGCHYRCTRSEVASARSLPARMGGSRAGPTKNLPTGHLIGKSSMLCGYGCVVLSVGSPGARSSAATARAYGGWKANGTASACCCLECVARQTAAKTGSGSGYNQNPSAAQMGWTTNRCSCGSRVGGMGLDRTGQKAAAARCGYAGAPYAQPAALTLLGRVAGARSEVTALCTRFGPL